ncbi:hypothetical protein TNIN_237701 [Trichonephila inaurata madagascariensis]|uniref:Uncharacterized protein n=1 Tax=Trichonephila inaurata madagascariensis TaxID=2747483 RepID=A0A8X6XG70_9ARAC|nr:hypothetical protein TNIN_237701 [Trichonephila inaurata madagascariensis]
MARSRLLTHFFQKLLSTNFDSLRIKTSTTTRFRTHHYKGMKIHPDETRSYRECENCPEIKLLTPKHIFECPAFTPKALNVALIPLLEPL